MYSDPYAYPNDPTRSFARCTPFPAPPAAEPYSSQPRRDGAHEDRARTCHPRGATCAGTTLALARNATSCSPRPEHRQISHQCPSETQADAHALCDLDPAYLKGPARSYANCKQPSLHAEPRPPDAQQPDAQTRPHQVRQARLQGRNWRARSLTAPALSATLHACTRRDLQDF